MKLRFKLTSIALFYICGCDRSVAGNDDLLTPNQVERDAKAAQKGDSGAAKRLAFHFGVTGDKVLSQQYFAKCLSLHNPDCLAEEANTYFAKYADRRTRPDDKSKYLSLAVSFNHQALISADKDDSGKIEGYQAQGRTFLAEQSKIPNSTATE